MPMIEASVADHRSKIMYTSDLSYTSRQLQSERCDAQSFSPDPGSPCLETCVMMSHCQLRASGDEELCSREANAAVSKSEGVREGRGGVGDL